MSRDIRKLSLYFELDLIFDHLQEELAFVLEMLEVYDEALVQYDELDALFTQFVLNSHLTGNLILTLAVPWRI